MFTLYRDLFDHNSDTLLYVQLYQYIKEEIISGRLRAGERLPSIRKAAADGGLSVTTVGLAYEQLETEGYVVSRPQSGFYVSTIPELKETGGKVPEQPPEQPEQTAEQKANFLYDPDSFDFRTWKKCISRVYSECTHELFSKSEAQGEAALRREIARYVYSSRGVHASPEQVVIAAGTQQLVSHLCRILKIAGIEHISVEKPGYDPVRRMFRDNGFSLADIPVKTDGIETDLLPANLPSAVYVCPANQFPTGAVMSAAKRYAILEWAKKNHSYIIEDDYDSPLRYFGRPIPALQGLDREERVVYLGSFSSTLFPAIRISYMVLPAPLLSIFRSFRDGYTQTCSKTEQLALAFFMEEGAYESNIRKLRTLYARKLQTALRAFRRYGSSHVVPYDTKSGVILVICVKGITDADALCRQGAEMGIRIAPFPEGSDPEDGQRFIIYYNQIPMEMLEARIRALCGALFSEDPL